MASRTMDNSPQSFSKVTADAVEDTPLLRSYPPANDGRPVVGGSPFMGGVSVARFWAIFILICLTYFIACFDSTIMASTHPVITSYFRSANSASWLSTAFILTSTSCQPMMGRLSDTFGRKVPYLCGLLLFSVATAWCALAQSMLSFILARAACGVGAGVTLSLGSFLLSDMVPIEVRGIYQAYLNINYGVACVMGAATGGIMTEVLGWRWTFGIQVPIFLICFVLAALVIPRDIGKSELERSGSMFEWLRKFDSVGSLLLTSLLAFLILGLNLGGNIYPWTHPFVIASLCVSVALVPAFLLNEKHHPRPVIPLEFILRSPYWNLVLANVFLTCIVNAILFNAPLFFRAVLFESPSQTGFRLIVIYSMSSLTGALTGFLVTWTRRLKWPMMVGSTMLLFGTISVAWGFQRGLPSVAYSLVLLPSSLGQGFCFPGSVMAILGVSTQEQQAVVTSILILARNIGVVMGVAYSSLLFQNSLVHYLNIFVTGPERDEIIIRVRESIDVIMKLKQPYQEQVVEAYAQSLRLTYISTIVLGCFMVAVLLPLRLPRLEHK